MAAYHGTEKKSPPKGRLRLHVRGPDGRLRVAATVRGRVLERSSRGLWAPPNGEAGWALNEEILETAARLGVDTVEVPDPERGRLWTIPLQSLRDGDLIVTSWGRQCVRPLTAWGVHPLQGATLQTGLFPVEAP